MSPKRLIIDLRHAIGLRPHEWLDLAVATLELAIARSRLGSGDPRTLLLASHNEKGSVVAPQRGAGASDIVDRVAFAIPRVAARVPWRADCLVQALAARRWLLRKGIATKLHVGARENRSEPFEAHAWLEHEDKIVTGGDITGYVPMKRPDPNL